MKHLKDDEWYLWRRHSDKKYPWERYLNTDFLKSERKRIDEDERFINIRYNARSESG